MKLVVATSSNMSGVDNRVALDMSSVNMNVEWRGNV
jgi:hypothetical protein